MIYGGAGKSDPWLLGFLLLEITICVLLATNSFRHFLQLKTIVVLGVLSILVLPAMYWIFGVQKNGIAQAGALLFIIPICIVQIFLTTMNFRNQTVLKSPSFRILKPHDLPKEMQGNPKVEVTLYPDGQIKRINVYDQSSPAKLKFWLSLQQGVKQGVFDLTVWGRSEVYQDEKLSTVGVNDDTAPFPKDWDLWIDECLNTMKEQI